MRLDYEIIFINILKLYVNKIDGIDEKSIEFWSKLVYRELWAEHLD